jgi:hypothetical protein
MLVSARGLSLTGLCSISNHQQWLDIAIHTICRSFSVAQLMLNPGSKNFSMWPAEVWFFIQASRCQHNATMIEP